MDEVSAKHLDILADDFLAVAFDNTDDDLMDAVERLYLKGIVKVGDLRHNQMGQVFAEVGLSPLQQAKFKCALEDYGIRLDH